MHYFHKCYWVQNQRITRAMVDIIGLLTHKTENTSLLVRAYANSQSSVNWKFFWPVFSSRAAIFKSEASVWGQRYKGSVVYCRLTRHALYSPSVFAASTSGKSVWLVRSSIRGLCTVILWMVLVWKNLASSVFKDIEGYTGKCIHESKKKRKATAMRSEELYTTEQCEAGDWWYQGEDQESCTVHGLAHLNWYKKSCSIIWKQW